MLHTKMDVENIAKPSDGVFSVSTSFNYHVRGIYLKQMDHHTGEGWVYPITLKSTCSIPNPTILCSIRVYHTSNSVQLFICRPVQLSLPLVSTFSRKLKKNFERFI